MELKRFQSPRFVFLFLLVSMALWAILWFLMVWDDIQIRELDLAGIERLRPEERYEVGIERLEVGTAIRISGYVFERHTDSSPVEIRVVLPVSASKGYILPTTVTFRGDITKEMNDGTKYDWSGFEVFIPKHDPLSALDDKTPIFLWTKINGKERLIDTGKTLLEGKDEDAN